VSKTCHTLPLSKRIAQDIEEPLDGLLGLDGGGTAIDLQPLWHYGRLLIGCDVAYLDSLHTTTWPW